eukprot:15266685-Heterocapsa_arctica.AAC.1
MAWTSPSTSTLRTILAASPLKNRPRWYWHRLCAKGHPLLAHAKRARICSGAAVTYKRHPPCGICR